MNRLKRCFHLLLIIALSLSACPAHAATEQRSLVEFCDLYAMRMIENSSEEFRAFIGPGIYSEKGTETEHFVYTGAGSLMIDKETFRVNSVCFNLMAIKENGYTEYIERCTAVVAALEFSQSEEDMIEAGINSGRKPDEKPVWDQAADIVNNIVYGIIAGADSLLQQLQSGQEILICARNYEYYIQYRVSSAGIGFIDIIAKVR